MRTQPRTKFSHARLGITVPMEPSMLMNIRVPRAHTGTLYWDRVNRIVSPAQLATTVEPKDSVLSLGNAQQVEDLFPTSSFNFDQVRPIIHGPFNSRLHPTYKF